MLVNLHVLNKPIKKIIIIVMRCKNCSWPNRPGATTCSKCNSPLTDTPSQPADTFDADKTALIDNTPADATPRGETPLRGTVIETDAVSDRSESAPANCPKCQYPVRPDAVKCPNCGTVLSNAAPHANEGYRRQSTVGIFDGLSQQSTALNGTVNPMTQIVVPEFSLTLQPRDGEHLTEATREFTGDDVTLNRANTEPGNNTITSREQARITFEDGRWYIEDRSAYKTTFVQAGRRTELRNGDVILMGSRMAVFHCDDID